MAEVSEAAKLKACELANADDPASGWEPDDISKGGSPVIRTLALFVQQVSDAAKAVRDHDPFDRAITAMVAPFILPDPPVDLLVAEAREIAAHFYNECGGGFETDSAQVIRRGEGDNTIAFQCALAGLKRGLKIVEDQS